MNKSRILILEDALPAVKVLRASLGERHDLVFIPNEHHALSLLRSEHFDLIICRVFLEEADPFQFLHAVRSDERLQKVPFICFAGLQTKRARQLNEALAKSFLKLGAAGYIKIDDYCIDESFDIDKLRADIEHFLLNSHVA
ncbi:MAG TPA: hypothetical protein V6D22_02985 [Candidatus Obscuribacterales bacterium]